MIKTLLTLTLFALTGCAGILPPAERAALANNIAMQHSLKPKLLGNTMPLQAFYRPQALQQDHVRVYIEGDGFAYVTSSVPSPDPTPTNPITLRLAAADMSPNVLYLARPCQFTKQHQKNCPQKFWTTHRYSREAVEIYHQILNNLKQQYAVKTFDLVGYSGGGVIAAVLTAERDDITALRTVASNLDVAAFIQHHRISAMSHSLNPTDYAQKLKNIPQKHFAGAEDAIVVPDIIRAYINKINGNASYLDVMEGAEHSGPWHEHWPNLLAKPLQSNKN